MFEFGGLTVVFALIALLVGLLDYVFGLGVSHIIGA